VLLLLWGTKRGKQDGFARPRHANKAPGFITHTYPAASAPGCSQPSKQSRPGLAGRASKALALAICARKGQACFALIPGVDPSRSIAQPPHLVLARLASHGTVQRHILMDWLQVAMQRHQLPFRSPLFLWASLRIPDVNRRIPTRSAREECGQMQVCPVVSFCFPCRAMLATATFKRPCWQQQRSPSKTLESMPNT